MRGLLKHPEAPTSLCRIGNVLRTHGLKMCTFFCYCFVCTKLLKIIPIYFEFFYLKIIFWTKSILSDDGRGRTQNLEE